MSMEKLLVALANRAEFLLTPPGYRVEPLSTVYSE